MPTTDVLLRLVEDDVVLMDTRLSQLLDRLDGSTPLGVARAETGLTATQVRRWRQQFESVVGHDPLRRGRRGLVPSPQGRSLWAEYRKQNAALRVHLSAGMRVPLLAVDGVVRYEGRLVAVKRRYFPHEGTYSLPGGIVEYGEATEDAVVREIREETGLRTRGVSLIGVYSQPDRDPRGHVISIAYALEVVGGSLRSGSDAVEVGLLDLEDLPEMGFDHRQIVADFLAKITPTDKP